MITSYIFEGLITYAGAFGVADEQRSGSWRFWSHGCEGGPFACNETEAIRLCGGD